MNEGLTYEELKLFADLIIKSNMVQLVSMKNHIEEQMDRLVGEQRKKKRWKVEKTLKEINGSQLILN